MKIIIFRILILLVPFLINGQGIFSNELVSATLSPVIGTNDLELNVRSQCTEIHQFNSFNYNFQANIVNLCYRNSGLLMTSTINSIIILPNANLSGSQSLIINSYYFFGLPEGNCNSNLVFDQPITLTFEGPLTQSRIFTLNNAIFETKKVSLYPNPNTGTFSIDLPINVSKAMLSIYDMAGKKILEVNKYSSGENIQLQHLAKGLYLVKVDSDETSETLKFLVK